MPKTDPNIDIDAREITFSCASTEPFERWDDELGEPYLERLVMTPDACCLDRLNGGASILRNHNTDSVMGKVVSAWLDDGVLYVRARFRKSDTDSVALFSDIADGTVPNVSIGYMVKGFTRREDGDTVYHDISDWEIFEVSVAVGVPADPTVGFYRSFPTSKITTKKEAVMPAEKRSGCDPDEENKAGSEAEETEETAAEDEKDETGAEDEESEAEESEDTEDDASDDTKKSDESDKKEDRSIKTKTTDIKIRSLNSHRRTNTMAKEKFNLSSALRFIATGNGGEFEREVSADLYRSIGMAPGERSIMIPFNRDFTGFTSANNSGEGLVDKQNRPELLVDYIRTKIGVKTATFLTGLKGPVTFPVQTGTSTVSWVSDLNSDVGSTAPTVANITLTPHKMGAYVPIGKDLLVEGNPDAQNLVMRDLLGAIAVKLGTTMLKGNASSPAITGLNTAAGVQTNVIASIASATWSDMTNFAGKIEGKEFAGKLEFIMSASDKAAFKTISKDTGSGRFLCEDNKIDGCDVHVDGSLSSGDIFFGDFSNILVGQWGGLEIMIDPYRYARSGGVEVIANLIADIAIRNPATFVKRTASVS